jgi:hypothetical protein
MHGGTAVDDPKPRGCRVTPDPNEPLTLGDMRKLLARAAQLELPDYVIPRFITPLPPRNRYSVCIVLADDGPAATIDDVPQDDPEFDPTRYGAEQSKLVDP